MRKKDFLKFLNKKKDSIRIYDSRYFVDGDKIILTNGYWVAHVKNADNLLRGIYDRDGNEVMDFVRYERIFSLKFTDSACVNLSFIKNINPKQMYKEPVYLKMEVTRRTEHCKEVYPMFLLTNLKYTGQVSFNANIIAMLLQSFKKLDSVVVSFNCSNKDVIKLTIDDNDFYIVAIKEGF